MQRIVLNLLGALAVCSPLYFHLSTAIAQGASYTLLTTFTNPSPAIGGFFGRSVAAVGTDRVLIGAARADAGVTDAGAAYLFSSSGILLTTFTNPTPKSGDDFGQAVAAVGTDLVLVGAPNDTAGAVEAGAAYLFSTNGALLTTLTNPLPGVHGQFGFSMAAVGSDRVLIGAATSEPTAYSHGAAHLYNTNGALLTTFTNPYATTWDTFGVSVAALGNDRVLIGGNVGVVPVIGAVYLFSTNGALLTAFTNPTPQAFGLCTSVAAIGNDQVLIGYRDSADVVAAGEAYLFSTTGMLLTTFVNPTPVYSDLFGISVTGVGVDRVVIGTTGHDMGVGDSNEGAAYVFSTNGEFLTTLSQPTLPERAFFGESVAALGADRVLIGSRAEMAYLFKVSEQASEAPSLAIRLTHTNTMTVSWPVPSTGWTLQENTNGVASVNWSNAPGTIQDDGTNKVLIVDTPTGNRFYRLFKP